VVSEKSFFNLEREPDLATLLHNLKEIMIMRQRLSMCGANILIGKRVSADSTKLNKRF
jgi:hypothetical protein